MTDLISRVAAVIQQRSIARLGGPLSNEVCVDFARAIEAELFADDLIEHLNKQARKDYRAKYIAKDGVDGIHGTDSVCGELEDGA